LLILVAAMMAPALAKGTVDDALSFAYEAALPYHKQYAFRRDAWGGISVSAIVNRSQRSSSREMSIGLSWVPMSKQL